MIFIVLFIYSKKIIVKKAMFISLNFTKESIHIAF